MANSHTQARASIDLGAGLVNSPFTGNRNKMVRNHPPRLQHSPSLPNIWFPPHSGPIPSRIEDSNRDLLERPVSPTLTLGQKTSITSSLTPKKPLKLQMRRRIDHDHGHSLLTPPLTPSSSMRTTTSVGSSDNAEVAHDTGVEPQGKEQEFLSEATHFLLLGNISKMTPSDALRSSIVGSLTTPPVGYGSDVCSSLSVPHKSAIFGPLNEDSIKGVFFRCQKSHGIVMLAFFDLRHAAVAKTILSTPSESPLADCIGDDPAEAGRQAWISCQFVTADELAKTIGNSSFLASVDGGFYISVQGKQTSRSTGKGELRVVDDRYLDECNVTTCHELDAENGDEPGDAKREINLTMLKSMLSSFGTLKSFSPIDPTSNKEAHIKIFCLEYYDVREANAAYAALDGQVLFGMKLQVFGREIPIDQPQCPPENEQGCSSPTFCDHSKNIIPFPSTTATAFNGGGELQIGPPGHYSQTRERFFYPEPTRQRPRSISAGQNVLSNPISPPLSFIPSLLHPAPSPTCFYNSSPVENQNLTQYPPNFSGQRPMSQFFIDHSGRPYAQASSPGVDTLSGLTHSPSFESLAPTSNTLIHQDPGLQFYGPHHDCYYCPSRSIPGTSDRYYASYSTSSPLYHPRPTQTLTGCYSTTPSPVPPPIAMNVPGYDYENSNVQSFGLPPNAVMPNWAFEPTMIATSHPTSGDFWCPEPNRIIGQGHQNVAYYAQPTRAPYPNSSPLHLSLEYPFRPIASSRSVNSFYAATVNSQFTGTTNHPRT
ncbi:hypothetical protein BDZ94DRAFT_431185 [Collybia nuda]|uniref:Uncharacterized protein n=1 Tax=Collybia nuda TaxID=64659 RepID=A0A9P5Y985_9AGAR|nr:hypothetical protein BDZ94DRAFT_431185 [Collybia nuda]